MKNNFNIDAKISVKGDKNKKKQEKAEKSEKKEERRCFVRKYNSIKRKNKEQMELATSRKGGREKT
jgi:hypothetical protein